MPKSLEEVKPALVRAKEHLILAFLQLEETEGYESGLLDDMASDIENHMLALDKMTS